MTGEADAGGGANPGASNGSVPNGQSGASPTAPSVAHCGSTPKQLVDLSAVSMQTNAAGISAGMPFALDATSLYFVMGYTLMRVPLQGGSPTVLAHLPDAEPLLSQNIQPLLTSTNIVVPYIPAGGDDAEIVSVPIEGGSPIRLATGARGGGVAVSGPDVYFSDSDGVKTIPASGGAARLLTSQAAPGAGSFAVIGSQIVMFEGTGTVVAIPVAGGPPTTLATQQQNPSFPLACGKDICWWTGAAPNPLVNNGPGQIVRLDPNGHLTTIPGAPSFPWALAFDGSSFFEAVGCDACSGTIMRVPLSGTPATMTSGGFVAVDDECAYFTSLGPVLLASGVSGTGVYSVSKAYSTCCDANNNCTYTTGACPVVADAGTD